MFGHLHVHSEYSELDGMGTVMEYLQRAKELGMGFLALTEHGNCSSHYDLFKYAPEFGIKPIYGCEFYFDNETESKRNHLVLLAKDNTGLKNIYKLHEWSYVNGFHGKPRINMEVLRKHTEGIICLSACVANIIPRSIAEGDYATAKFWASEFKRLFGADFYLEVQDTSDPFVRIANKGVVQLAKELDIEIVATNDVHYALKEDYDIHDTMICMQTNSKKDDVKRFKFDRNEYWLKSRNEMRFTELTPEDRERALSNTSIIADKCNATLVRGEYLPKFYNTPKGMTEEEYLRQEVSKKYKENIFQKGLHTDDYYNDVKHELDVIESTGYSGYHLIVSDFVNYSRANGILVGDGRGSGAGCKVAYILGITKVEPNKHHLLFERFLDYGRQPDYDIDFADNNAIFSYLQQKYGEANVARIVAFGTLQPKAVVRKVMSAFGVPETIVAQINGCMPDMVKYTLDDAFRLNSKLKDWEKKYPEEFKHIRRLEGRKSHKSQHAGGVIIYENLSEYIPVHTDSDDRTKRVVSFDKKMAEDLGFCKIDCLGLEALSTLNATINSIKEMEGVDVNLDEIDYEDSAVYDDLCAGNVYGVFQLENQRDIVIRQKPRCFADIVALSSIIRPGTCDLNEYFEHRLNKNYTIPEKERWFMEESDGLIIYQEQYLLKCKVHAGWTIGFADKNVRKNKKLKEDKELEAKFISDCATHSSLSEHDARRIWEEIVEVAGGGYSFNKSHSVSYSVITYRNAWLKHYYPIHFYASLLTKLYHDDKKKHLIPNVIAECKKLNIPILPPDINHSESNFIPTKEGIRFALTSVKGLGDSATEHLISLRPISSLEDMVTRATRKHLKENVVDNLIKCGCFGDNRYDILLEYKRLINSKKEVVKKDNGEYELESIGIYLSLHPMDKYSFKHITEFPNDKPCLVGGIVKEVTEKPDKKGNIMAFITIEANTGSIQCLCFASSWTKKMQKVFVEGNVVMVKGKRSNMSCLVNEGRVIE